VAEAKALIEQLQTDAAGIDQQYTGVKAALSTMDESRNGGQRPTARPAGWISQQPAAILTRVKSRDVTCTWHRIEPAQVCE
jgi:hypothetical protein